MTKAATFDAALPAASRPSPDFSGIVTGRP